MKKENGGTLVPSGQIFLPVAAIGPSVMRGAHASCGGGVADLPKSELLVAWDCAMPLNSAIAQA
jgi:hypothetical protein